MRRKASGRSGRISALRKNSYFLILFFAHCGNDFSGKNVEETYFRTEDTVSVCIYGGCDADRKVEALPDSRTGEEVCRDMPVRPGTD